MSALKFIARHPGCLFGGFAALVGIILFNAGLPGLALFVVSIAAVSIGDAWDEETRL